LAEFKNPNQQGGGDNRSLLVMMLVLVAVFFGLQYFRARSNPQTVSPNAPAAQGATQSAAPVTSPAAVATTAGASATSAKPSNPTVPVVQASAESTTIIENELYRITFTNRGAQVTSWVMKRTPSCTCQDSDGKPLNIVHTQAAEKFGYPLSLYTYEPSLTASLSQALYVPSATGQLAAPATLSFKYSSGDLQVTKIFSFDETYVLHADVQVTRNGSPVRALINWPGGFGDQDNAQSYAGAQFDNYRNGKDDHVAPKKVSGGDTLNAPFDWAGVSDPFFAAIFLPSRPDTASVITQHNQLDVAKTIRRTGIGSGSPAKGPIEVPILGAALGDTSGHTQTRIYVGPKAISVLKAVRAADPKVTLEPLLEFGFWGAIGKYLFLSLQFIHNHLVAGWSGSWGWSIIILTILINILMLPFRIKTMQNGLKMQRIQPQMNEIKEKYKKYKATDPKRNEMNAEIMKLQKDNGVNMFGGCIPTLITLPLLYAFFTMLPRVVELRQAHWLWLPDLQAPDPWHILPILMVVSMFLVQYYTPSPGVDPQQQKMMAFMMPAISGYFTWTYGSGLALYWAVGNIISIAQQAVMNRTSLGQEMREIAAKRARRKTGTGVTIKGKR
jgi:YidC/Oxa1 family membrane protein insertase